MDTMETGERGGGGGGAVMNDYEKFQDFIKRFTASINPDDQLPIRVSNYTITKDEFKPEVMNFARQYLQDRWEDYYEFILNESEGDSFVDG